MRALQVTGLALAVFLGLAACGSSAEPDQEQAQEATGAPQADEEQEQDDPFEDIPADAPIHDMSEEDLAREMLGCDEGLSVEECEQQYQEEVEAASIEDSIAMCQEYIDEARDGGWAVGSCSNYTMTNSDFYELFESRTGEAVPADLRDPDPTCEELNEVYRESVAGFLEDTGSTTAEWAVEGAEEQLSLYGCEVSAPQDADGGSSGVSFDSCEEADFHWGGLMNDDLGGLDIDDQELAETEAWMQDNGCW